MWAVLIVSAIFFLNRFICPFGLLDLSVSHKAWSLGIPKTWCAWELYSTPCLCAGIPVLAELIVIHSTAFEAQRAKLQRETGELVSVGGKGKWPLINHFWKASRNKWRISKRRIEMNTSSEWNRREKPAYHKKMIGKIRMNGWPVYYSIVLLTRSAERQ